MFVREVNTLNLDIGLNKCLVVGPIKNISILPRNMLSLSILAGEECGGGTQMLTCVIHSHWSVALGKMDSDQALKNPFRMYSKSLGNNQ